MENHPLIHFIDEPIQVAFDKPPQYEKSPPCPAAFTWQERTWQVKELLSEWQDFRRRGRMAENMKPEHAARARIVGSWGVGRFHFVVRVADDRIFELYYDRAPQDASDRKGHWFLLGERRAG